MPTQYLHLAALPIKACALILALFCYTGGHERALLRIALVRAPRSGERRLINNTALLTRELSAGEIFRKLTGIYPARSSPPVPVVMTLLPASLIPSSK